MYCIVHRQYIYCSVKQNKNECRERKITNEKGDIGILYSIASQKEPAYTSDIIQKLQEAKLIVVEGTLYPLLTRLKNSELLSYQWIESTQGPPRKYYQLTPKGEEFLGELETSWQELNDTINHIRNN